jgi:antitoxin FitA
MAMANVQIRGVPDEVHRRLRSQAGLAGQSLNEYLLERVTELAGTLTWSDLLDRVAEREPYTGPPAAEILRQEREAR